MKLLILDTDENITKTNRIIHKIKFNSTLYLNNNIFNKKLDYERLDDLFRPEYASKIDKFTRKLAKSWYNPIKNEFKYDNLTLSELIENKFLKIWPVLLKIEILTKFIEEEKPEEIFIITEYEEDIRILKEISKNIKINYFLLRKYSNKKLKFKNLFYKVIARFQNYLFKKYLNGIKTKNNILVLGNLRQLLPLLKKLKDNPNNLVIRGGENLGRGLFAKNCDYYITFKEFSNKEIKNKLKNIKLEFINKWKKIKFNERFINNLNYKINLFKILEPSIKEIIFKDFLDIIKYIEIIKYIGKKVDVVVTHNDVIAFEKTVIKTANNLKIPTITMIEGFLSLKKIKSGTQFIPFSSKIMALHSKSQKDFIIKKYKISEDRLVVTGHPMFDIYYTNKKTSKIDLCRKLKVPLNKKLILYATERYNHKNKSESSIWSAHTEKQYLSIYEELFEAIREIKDSFLIIKNHPSLVMNNKLIKDIAKRYGVKNFSIVNNLDLYTAIKESNVVILRLSTIGLEAMMLKTPVIVMDTGFNSNDNVGYTKLNAALHVKRPGELKNVIENLLNDSNLKKRLISNMNKFVKHNYVNDGNSSLRMAKQVEKMIKENKI